MTSTLPQIPRSIAAQVKDCLARFDALLVDLDAKDDRSLSRAIDDASGRFKIWSSNIGAHRTGRRSLDHRLRDASHLQENVLMLLSGLAESLVDGRLSSKNALTLAKLITQHGRSRPGRESLGTSYSLVTASQTRVKMKKTRLNRSSLRSSSIRRKWIKF